MQTSNFRDDEVTIRPAVESDVEVLASLLAEAGFDYPTDVADVRERFLELNHEGDCILVAVYYSSVIGMVTLHRTASSIAGRTDESCRWSFPKAIAAAEREHASLKRRNQCSAIGAAGGRRSLAE